MLQRSHFGHIRGSANQPTMDRFESFSTFSYIKLELKGGPFYEKIANSCIWGPTMHAISDKWGCQPIGPNLTNLNFFKNIFLYKIQIQMGVYFMKKLPSHVITALCGGPFWSNAWLPTGQILADQIFFYPGHCSI